MVEGKYVVMKVSKTRLKFLKNQGFRAIFVYADFMNPF